MAMTGCCFEALARAEEVNDVQHPDQRQEVISCALWAAVGCARMKCVLFALVALLIGKLVRWGGGGSRGYRVLDLDCPC